MLLHVLIMQVGWVRSARDHVWAPSFTTYTWQDAMPGFHPSALYKEGELKFCAKFNRGSCSAAPFCSR